MKINYSSGINTLGYGYSGYNICKSLIKMGHDITLFPIGTPEESMGNELAQHWYGNKSEHLHSHGANLTTSGEPNYSVRIWHQDNIHPRIGFCPHFGFPIFELDIFSQVELSSIALCDELMVCSEWARQIVLKYFPQMPVHIVPLGIDPSIFFSCPIPQTTNTIFLSVGKWEIRKGHDFTIECFNKAFSPTDNVELWMMCDNPFLENKGADWINKCRTSKLGSKIKIIPRQPNHQNVYYIMSKADVGLFPSRAEGWNLELLEMMSIGKHVICTDYSAHTEFCNKSNSFLIDIDSKELAYDGIWFHNNGYWAHLGQNQEDQYVEHLRNLHKNKQEKNIRLNQAGIETGRKYTWEYSAKQLIKALE